MKQKVIQNNYLGLGIQENKLDLKVDICKITQAYMNIQRYSNVMDLLIKFYTCRNIRRYIYIYIYTRECEYVMKIR